VATIDDLEEGNLRVSRKVDILCTIGDELHKATGSHVCLYLVERKKIWRNGQNSGNTP
jgi:ERCC4-related helicase